MHRVAVEGRLLEVDRNAVLARSLEYRLHMLEVFPFTLGVDQDIIQVDEHKVERSENLRYGSLEGVRSVL